MNLKLRNIPFDLSDMSETEVFEAAESLRPDRITNGLKTKEHEVTVPLHTRLSDDDVEYVISNFSDFINNIR